MQRYEQYPEKQFPASGEKLGYGAAGNYGRNVTYQKTTSARSPSGNNELSLRDRADRRVWPRPPLPSLSPPTLRCHRRRRFRRRSRQRRHSSGAIILGHTDASRAHQDDKSFRDFSSLSITRFPPFFAQTDVKWVRSGGTVALSLLSSLSPAASRIVLPFYRASSFLLSPVLIVPPSRNFNCLYPYFRERRYPRGTKSHFSRPSTISSVAAAAAVAIQPRYLPTPLSLSLSTGNLTTSRLVEKRGEA